MAGSPRALTRQTSRRPQYYSTNWGDNTGVHPPPKHYLQQRITRAAQSNVAFRASTAELEERWQARPMFANSVVNLGSGRFVVGKGAVPIVIDGTVVGAVGVSGGIPADLDHAIAEAAVQP